MQHDWWMTDGCIDGWMDGRTEGLGSRLPVDWCQQSNVAAWSTLLLLSLRLLVESALTAPGSFTICLQAQHGGWNLFCESVKLQLLSDVVGWRWFQWKDELVLCRPQRLRISKSDIASWDYTSQKGKSALSSTAVPAVASSSPASCPTCCLPSCPHRKNKLLADMHDYRINNKTTIDRAFLLSVCWSFVVPRKQPGI